MLDYYGSMLMPKKDIINVVIKSYIAKNFSESYIRYIMEYLYSKKILNDKYSISGWNMFHSEVVNNHIKDYIRLDTVNRKKIVAFMFQLTNSDLVYEPNIYKKICDNVRVKYYG